MVRCSLEATGWAQSVLGLLVLLLCPVHLWAEKPQPTFCAAPQETLDKHRYLRALSMDLKGEPASLEEHDALELEDDVSQKLIDQWLDSAQFAKQVARYHRNLIWNSVLGKQLVDNRAIVANSHYKYKDAVAYYAPHRSKAYRGVSSIPCLDKPATFDPVTNAPIFEDDPKSGAKREGWVEVTPYFAPETTIKVCASDAQTNLFSADGTSCKSASGLSRNDCGCGPNLNWCAQSSFEVGLRRFLGVSVDKRVEALIQSDEPYTNVFLNNISYFNGPLIHFWKHLTERYDDVYLDPVPVPVDLLPDNVPANDLDTWYPVEMGPEHAGILTSAAYLIRHTTGRRRALRVYEGLFCQPFLPPSNGLVFGSEDKGPEPDLRKKDGCKFCHSILEPAAQHWGRWTEFGASYMSPESHPPCRADCQVCALSGKCSADCKFNYVTTGLLTKELQFLGWLKPYQFMVPNEIMDAIQSKATATKVQCDPELVAQTPLDHIELGPKIMIQKAMFDGRLARCTARNVVHWLMGRMPDKLEKPWIESLAAEFTASGYSFKALVKAVVTHKYYRRVE